LTDAKESGAGWASYALVAPALVVIAAFWRANHRAMAGFRALDAVTLRMSSVVAGAHQQFAQGVDVPWC